MKKYVLLIVSLIIVSTGAVSQHDSDEHEKHIQHHRLVLFTGYGLIPGAIDEEGNRKVKVIPVLGLDYEYWFSHKIALALQNDIELAAYVVERDHQDYLNRDFAFVSSLVFIYEPLKDWAVFAGPGYEFEQHENFAVLKVGTEIAKSFQDGWGVGLTLAYDIKEVNSSASFGVSVGKRLGKK